MASHFSTLGLSVETSDDFLALAEQVADHCTTFDAPGGRYLHWSCPSGAELWLQVGDGDSLDGMNPHFRGESIVRVGLTARIVRFDGNALDGAFEGWAEPSNDDPESGRYPFVFDAPDFRLHDELRVPAQLEVQVAAFAHHVSMFPSPEAYAASQSRKYKFASKSFIPTGSFPTEGRKDQPAEARAMFTGHVRKAELRRNELTGGPFWWALVETLGGVFDVVIDPELVDEAPREDTVLSGSFWLSGRLCRSRPSDSRSG